MRTLTLSTGALLVGGVLGTFGVLTSGCKSGGEASPTTPTTMNTPSGNMRSGLPQTMPVNPTPSPGGAAVPTPPAVTGTNSREPAVTTAPAAALKPAIAMTHVLTADEAFYKEKPAEGAKPDGTLKAGSKVLLVIPGSPYSQVLTEDGTTVYAPTDGLDPISKK